MVSVTEQFGALAPVYGTLVSSVACGTAAAISRSLVVAIFLT